MLCSFSKKNFFVQHLEATSNNIGNAGAESISRALKTNTSLKSLDISGVLFYYTPFSTQQSISRALQSNTSLTWLYISCVTFCSMYFNTKITKLDILVLRVFREHSNQTLHSNHLIFQVCVILFTCFTQQATKLEILVLRVFREHFNQTLHSPHLIFQVCCIFMFHTTDNQIGYSGTESISRALQSNTSLKSLNISGVCCNSHVSHNR